MKSFSVHFNVHTPIQKRKAVFIFRFHHINFIEPPGKFGILLSVSTLQAPDFSISSSCAAVCNVSQKLSRTKQSRDVVAYLCLHPSFKFAYRLPVSQQNSPPIPHHTCFFRKFLFLIIFAHGQLHCMGNWVLRYINVQSVNDSLRVVLDLICHHELIFSVLIKQNTSYTATDSFLFNGTEA